MSTFFKIQTYKKPSQYSQYSQYSEYGGQSVIIGNNGNEIAECENVKQQPEPWYLKQPKKCNSCIHWKPTGKQRYWCYWIGECILDGQEVSINSKCRFTFFEQSAQQSSEVTQ